MAFLAFPKKRKGRSGKGMSPEFRATRLSRSKKKEPLQRFSVFLFLCSRPKKVQNKLRQALVTSDTRVSLVRVVPKYSAKFHFQALWLKMAEFGLNLLLRDGRSLRNNCVQLRESAEATRRVQSVTIPSSRVTPMCFLTVSSRPCLETNPHSTLRTPFAGHCLGAL